MSSAIYLVRITTGQPKPYQLRKKQAEHIDKNHRYHTPEKMAEDLGLLPVTVISYCMNKGHEMVKKNAKPNKKEKLFDFDDFKGGII